jgi:hypothetical protein
MATNRLSLLVVPVAAASLAVAACGGGDPSASAADTRAKMHDAALQFARCMREHGVNVPDPKPGNGGIMIQGGPGDKSRMDRAQRACQKYLEKVKPPAPSPEQEREMRENALAHARCMREHGIDFPDPTFQGGGRVTMKFPEGVDPQSPAFQAAEKACAKYQPKNGSLNFKAEPGGGKAGPGLSRQSTP